MAGPWLRGLMGAVGLDVAYERAAGDELFYRDAGGGEVAVLDLVGGYGSLLLGHHHPEVVAEVGRFLASGRPVHAQGSARPITERFAAELDRRAGGGHHVVLASTGAEAVEAALKHAVLETGGRTFIALEGGFHGKTLGAVQLAGSEVHREPFELSGVNVERVRLNDVDQLGAVLGAVERPAGFVFEPVQGEGGVRPMSGAFAGRAAELCAARGIPLIADECQSGAGRTGRFLACEGLGIRPDYIVLSKGLGGGVAKLAALLVRRERYRPAFELKHSSTFAGDELSSAVGLRVLGMVDGELLGRVRRRGVQLLGALRRVARAYPEVIAGVRGRGLMLAVELRAMDASASFMVRLLSAAEDLAVMAAAYLLRAHRVRVAPTLGAANTLRIQPSAFISEGRIGRAVGAIERLCELLRRGDAPGLTEHLGRGVRGWAGRPVSLREGYRLCGYGGGGVGRGVAGGDPGAPGAGGRGSAGARPTGAVRRVGWLCHLIDDGCLVSLEPAYAAWGSGERGALLDGLAPLANPVVMSEVDVRSAAGPSVRLYPIMLPVTSAWMKRCLDMGAAGAAAAIVQKGVDAARDVGCGLVALGQYTSIVTRGGRRLRRDSVGLTTGNSYSLALALEALAEAERQRGVEPSRATIAVVGAAGNIGQAAAQLLARRYGRTILLGSGRAGSMGRLRRLAGALPGARVETAPAALRAAEVVLATTSAVDRPLGPEHLAAGAVVCDLSVPSAVAGDLATARPDVMLIKGGVVRLPFEEDLGIVGFPLPRGRTYGCMAEALLLGFEGVTDRSFTGLVRPGGVLFVRDLARRHGFALADYKRRCVLGTGPGEVMHVDAA